LYWAEGTKEKDYRTGRRTSLNNSDPQMILLFRRWLEKFCSIKEKDLVYGLYIHKTADWRKAQKYWSKILSVPVGFIKIYFKRHKIKTNRKNVYKKYYGLLRIVVKKSVNLNRKITGWIEGIYK